MRCPKCENEQVDSVECEGCGLIFEKYRQVQARKKAAEVAGGAGNEKVGPGARIVQLLLLVVAVAGTTYYFTGYRPQQGDGSAQVSVDSARVVEEVQEITPSVQLPVASRPTVKPVAVPTSPIEHARKSTVTIETPWGTGSGFFINENYIVTNRHVIEFDEKKLAEFKYRVETARQMIELEQQKIEGMKRQLRQLPKGPSRSQLALIIQTREEELQKILPRHRQGEERLARLEEDIEPSDIKIVLADGSEHVANYLLVSESYDLALMSLFIGEWTYIKKPPEVLKLHQGDKVYTIGSPAGLRHTVTAGIFSGYRRHEPDGSMYLQTDAPINPGNSGGPLIDEQGYVRGVNTMILRDTEGIGFAIPIETVFEEFSSTLY